MNEPKEVHEWKEGFTTFKTEDGYLSWEGEIGAGRATVPQVVVSELARLAERVKELESMVGTLCPECIDDLEKAEAEITRLREALDDVERFGRQHGNQWLERLASQTLRGEGK